MGAGGCSAPERSLDSRANLLHANPHFGLAASSLVRGLEDATAHEVIHTTDYHLAVTARLALTKPSNQANGRTTLNDIKFDILNNEFDY